MQIAARVKPERIVLAGFAQNALHIHTRTYTYIHTYMHMQIASGVKPERIVLAGFAQGGVVALNAALQSKKRLGGVLALSTWLPRRCVLFVRVYVCECVCRNNYLEAC